MVEKNKNAGSTHSAALFLNCCTVVVVNSKITDKMYSRNKSISMPNGHFCNLRECCLAYDFNKPLNDMRKKMLKTCENSIFSFQRATIAKIMKTGHFIGLSSMSCYIGPLTLP